MSDEVGTSFGSSMFKLGMIVMMENPRAISEKCTRPCVKGPFFGSDAAKKPRDLGISSCLLKPVVRLSLCRDVMYSQASSDQPSFILRSDLPGRSSSRGSPQSSPFKLPGQCPATIFQHYRPSVLEPHDLKRKPTLPARLASSHKYLCDPARRHKPIPGNPDQILRASTAFPFPLSRHRIPR